MSSTGRADLLISILDTVRCLREEGEREGDRGRERGEQREREGGTGRVGGNREREKGTEGSTIAMHAHSKLVV